MKTLLAIALSILSLSVTTGAQQQSSNAQAPTTGRVKGILTYYFNANFGHKADVGSEVWLLEGRVDIPEDAPFEGCAYPGLPVGPGEVKCKLVKHTLAEGSGNFEISDVPAGQYTLVMRSSHSHGTSSKDLLGRTKVVRVELKAGETFDASRDFGMSAL
jgi:hypothetical protein